MLTTTKPNVEALIQSSWLQTRVIGHRGAAAYKPENTLESFEEAISCKADAAECDIHLSKDGEMVVMHDSTLDRTTKLKGAVKETLWETMQQAGIPSLADLTKVTKDRIPLVIEIKAGKGIEQKMVDHVKAEKMRDQVIVFSFGADHVAKVEEIDPEFYSVWLVGKKVAAENQQSILDEAKRIGASGIGFAYTNVTPEMVKLAQDSKMPVFVWTVPPGPEIDKLKAMKVNFIITNHPRDVRKQLGL